jgi:hypothetical protein
MLYGADITFQPPKNMKPFSALLAALFSVLVLSSQVHALPSFKGGAPSEVLSKKSDFEKLQPGDRVVLVCKASDSVQLIDIKDKKQAMQLCAEGKMIHCAGCHKHYKVLWRNPAGKTGGPDYKMVIVNAKDEPCMFMARLK